MDKKQSNAGIPVKGKGRRPAPAIPPPEDGWQPAAYLIHGAHCADGRDRYRAGKVKRVKTYPVCVCIGYRMWHLPGQAILDAERIMAGIKEPIRQRSAR